MSALLTQNQFFVNQKVKLIELTNEYKIRDEAGTDIGMIREEGQSKLKKVARFATNLDSMMTHRYGIYDADGTKVVSLVRPRAFVFSKVLVQDAGDQEVGRIEQARKVFKKVRFSVVGTGGEELAAIQAENWRAWNFTITGPNEQPLGRITKNWGGSVKEIFTTADNYMVEIDPSVSGNLRLLLVAAACGIDTAIKQNDK
ncbi:MAG: scramblase [Actinobacteria bacterium]|nr:scramblase [Actinomycetota bacterium]